MKKYEVLGGNLPVVVVELAAGESMITEKGSMSWMSSNMKMETTSGGGVKKMLGRAFSGESAFQNRYTAQGGDGMIAFASSFPGTIKAIELTPGKTIIAQRSAFLASEPTVDRRDAHELHPYPEPVGGSGGFGGVLPLPRGAC